jgi:hypothetical protein
MGEICSTHGDMLNTYRVVARKPDAKTPLGRLSCRWRDNIKMNLRDTVCEDRKLIELAHVCVQ